MFRYYFALAVRSLGRNKILNALVVLAIGLGIGASMTMVTVVYTMSGDPLPQRSAQLFYPHFDPSPPGFAAANSGDVGANFTWFDADNLLRADQADKQAMMAGGQRLAVHPERQGSKPFYVQGRYASAEFFEMFGAPFQAGAGWTAREDAQRARVVVLNAGLARKLFGDASAIGRVVRLNNTDFRVAGVLDDWHPQPLFYGGASGDFAFRVFDEFFLPLTTALEQDFAFGGGMSCWGKGKASRTDDQCAWLQFWVQLSSPSQVSAYQQFLSNYWRQQQLQRPVAPGAATLYGLMERLRQLNLVPAEVSLQLWLAFGFLGVCVLSTVGLLLAKFLGRSEEVSLRRAMGARRRDIFWQFGMESIVIGLVGGVFGLGLAYLGLWAVRQQPDGYAQLAHMDARMLLCTIVLSVLATGMAGILPAWRACGIEPGLHLKVQ